MKERSPVWEYMDGEGPSQMSKLLSSLPLILAIFLASSALAQTIGPAPAGEPSVVAQKVIQKDFETSVCSLVVESRRLGDGSIMALCNNGERFRVFSVQSIGPVALRCSAAEKLGVEGC